MSHNHGNSIQNTLRLGRRELHKFLEQVEQASQDWASPDREFVRSSYRVEAVNLVIEHGSGNRVTLPVATRNISRGGISILHSAYIHANTPCEIILNLPGDKVQSIPGKVVRCAHLSGRVHEVGITFRDQISTKELLGLDPLNEAYSLERVEPARLHGSILLLTTSDLDRDLLLMFLEDTNLLVNTADTIENAVTRLLKGCDLVIADYHLGSQTAPEFIHAMKEAGSDIPVVVLTSDKSETALDDIRESGASGVLSKPTTRDKLFQAIAEFLHADGDGGPLYSILSPADTTYPLLSKFLCEVPRMALNLEKAIRDNDQQACIDVVRTLSGTAAPLGFPDISALAIAAETRLGKSSLKSAAGEIRALIVACRRIKARPAA